MLRTLVVKEWVHNLLELRFLVCAGLCVFLAVVSVLVLREDLAVKRADYSSNRTIYRDQAQEYGSYRQLERQGVRVDRPPQNFQVLFYGVEKTLDRTAVVGGDFLPGFQGDLSGNPAVLLFPVADLLFVVAVVLSLLAFFISYDAVSGERESGTLKQVLSYPVPRDLLILAKWLGGYFSLALPFLVALVISALLISLSADIPFSGQDWEAFVLAGAVSLLLLAVMFSIGLFVSVRARSSTTAILTLLAIWVLLALVVPNAGPYVAEIVAPVPDVGTVEREISTRTKALSDEYSDVFRGDRRRMRNLSDTERSEFFRQMRERREELQTRVNQATAEVVRAYEERVRSQTSVARMLTRASPVAAYVYANTEIGETGVRHEEKLVNALRVYQREFARWVREQQEASGGGGGGGGRGGWFGGSDDDYNIDHLPTFDFRSENLVDRVSERTVDILLLAVFAVLFFMAAFLSFVRTDVT
ncbi:MAG: ABC transporter permease subunit [Gemmatimonadota bacterium]